MASDAQVTQSARTRTKRAIRPSHGWAALHLAELWHYRELLYFLTWRDIKVRYKQAVLGVAWAVLQPVLTVLVFTIVFNWIMKAKFQPTEVNGKTVPYFIYTYVGMLPWNLFSGALGRAGTSLVGNANLLTKVYFPRLVIPISAVVAGLVDFIIAFVVFLVLMAAFGIPPSWHMVALPLLLLIAMMTALAFGLWLSALNVLYRDVQYIIPFIIQLWLFLSAVFYNPPEFNNNPVLGFLFNLNPMVGVIVGFRWALIGGPAPNGMVALASAVMLVVLAGGLAYFKRMERTFADVV
jgi:lipopolysaccharide transport system permease protein